jgi:hypothetical protein
LHGSIGAGISPERHRDRATYSLLLAPRQIVIRDDSDRALFVNRSIVPALQRKFVRHIAPRTFISHSPA